MSKYQDGKTTYKEYIKSNFVKYKKMPSINSTLFALMSEIERCAVGRFEWKGIDGNGIAESRKIEEYLFFKKRCAIVDTKEYGLAVVPITPVGININGEPSGYLLTPPNGAKLTPVEPNEIDINGKKIRLEGDVGTHNAIIVNDSLIVGNGAIDGVTPWVEKFADAQISIDQQMINQRAPLLGYTKTKNDEQFISVQTVDIATGLNAMVIESQYADSIKALNLEGPFNVDKLSAMQHEYKSRIFNSLGIDSLQAFGKKERMIVDEVESNDESLAMILSDALRSRKNSLVNNPTAEKYGISVELARPYRISTYNANLGEETQGGVEDAYIV